MVLRFRAQGMPAYSQRLVPPSVSETEVRRSTFLTSLAERRTAKLEAEHT
jgi:hypothetical protein